MSLRTSFVTLNKPSYSIALIKTETVHFRELNEFAKNVLINIELMFYCKCLPLFTANLTTDSFPTYWLFLLDALGRICSKLLGRIIDLKS